MSRESIILSSSNFCSIFSMSKIKDPENMPAYLDNQLIPLVPGELEGWVGDSDSVETSTKFAFHFNNGYADFFLCFGREGNKSSAELSQGNAFQFHAVLAHTDSKWFSGKFSNEDLARVKDVIWTKKGEAVSMLGLVETSQKNPLNLVR